MIEYFSKILESVYKFVNPVYTQNEGLAKFDELKKSGKLERMFSSEIYEMFGIRGISSEI